MSAPDRGRPTAGLKLSGQAPSVPAITAPVRNLPDRGIRLGRVVEGGLAACGLLLLPASDVLWRGILPSVFALTLLSLLWNRREAHAVLAKTWPVLLPILLAILSVFWSVDPEVSLYRAIALAGTTAFGVFLAIRFSLDEQLTILACVLGLIACASAAVALVWPGYGVMAAPHAGAWAGVFHHKNSLGRIMALSSLVFFLLALGSRDLRWAAMTGVALSLALVAASRSLASLIVAIACFAVIGSLWGLRRLSRSGRTAVVIVGAAVVASAGSWGIEHRAQALSLLGADATLSGRTVLWTVLLEKARARPWFGYGYGAFWRGASGVSGEVQHTLNWDSYPIHAHNGFLDLVLELGVAGVLVFLLPLGVYGFQARRWAAGGRALTCLWPLTYLSFFVLSNLAESSLVRQNNIYWTLFVAAMSTVHRPASNGSRL